VSRQPRLKRLGNKRLGNKRLGNKRLGNKRLGKGSQAAKAER
jgi:hypothetical protein